MAAKKTKDGVAVAPASDPRVGAFLEAIRGDAKLASAAKELEQNRGAGGRRKFGSNALKVDGKLFALLTQGTLVVKLSKERVAALVANGVGAHFDPGHGRLMKGWLTVTHAKAKWVELAREAYEYVGGAR